MLATLVLLGGALAVADVAAASDPGVPDPGVPDPGVPDPGVPDPGVPDPGVPAPNALHDGVDASQDASPAAACVAFGDPCESGQKCCDAAGSFGVCNKFGQGSRCTIACPSEPSACPNDGRGCNHQSPPMCRSPRRGGGGKDKNKKDEGA